MSNRYIYYYIFIYIGYDYSFSLKNMKKMKNLEV